MTNGPGVAGFDPVVCSLFAPVVTALRFTHVLRVGSELFQCLGFSKFDVPFGTIYRFLQFLAEPCFRCG